MIHLHRQPTNQSMAGCAWKFVMPWWAFIVMAFYAWEAIDDRMSDVGWQPVCCLVTDRAFTLEVFDRSEFNMAVGAIIQL